MTNNVYTIDELVTGTETITITDDGIGIDLLQVKGNHPEGVEIDLNWTSTGGQPTSGEGIYFTADHIGHRLIVNGVIENATGGTGADLIQGNVLANILIGDFGSVAGGGDTLFGAGGNDRIYGGFGADLLGGEADDDLIMGGIGKDTINGGAGNDTVLGGAGADALSGGGDAQDMVSFSTSAAGVQVVLTSGATTTGVGGDAAGDQISGFIWAQGSAFADRIEDSDKATIAFDRNDNDFFGGGGKDLLLLGGGDDQGLGGTGADRIYGEIGDDSLFGDAGNDLLRGSRGQDQLTGGKGADNFVFALLTDSTVAAAQRDTIRDFSHFEHDRIDLSGLDADVAAEGDQAFHQVAGTTFDGSHGAMIFRAVGNNTLLLGDVDGDSQADFTILILGAYQYNETDFEF